MERHTLVQYSALVQEDPSIVSWNQFLSVLDPDEAKEIRTKYSTEQVHTRSPFPYLDVF